MVGVVCIKKYMYDFKNRTDFLKTKSYKCTIKVDSLVYFDLCRMKNSAWPLWTSIYDIYD
jgi:hypothetical protein